MVTVGTQTEVEELIRKAQAQPGITELMRVYGRYGEMMEQTRIYVEGNKPFARSITRTQST